MCKELLNNSGAATNNDVRIKARLVLFHNSSWISKECLRSLCGTISHVTTVCVKSAFLTIVHMATKSISSEVLL